MCECSRFEHVLVFPRDDGELLLFTSYSVCGGISLGLVFNMFLFSLGMMGNFCFLQVPCFVVGNFYHFKNEGYLLEVFKMKFF